MKKLLVLGAFVLTAITFANNHGNHTMGNNSMQGGMMSEEGCSPEMKARMADMGMIKDGKCIMMEGKGMHGGMGMMNNMTPEQKIAMEKEMIAIQEKQLEVRKLMNTTNPDMKKVEKLNAEISTMKTKHMESMKKIMGTPVKTN